MTTVDVWVDRIDRPAARLAISNGLFGPATAAFHRLQDVVARGQVAGVADAGGCASCSSDSVTTIGRR